MEQTHPLHGEGEKLIVQHEISHHVPLVGQLPKPDDRLFYNKKADKPKRKLTELKVNFGNLTPANQEQFRVLNYMTLPVVYAEDFYNRLLNLSRYSKLAYYKDILVGAISCRYEDEKNDKGYYKDGERVVYIMTITVLTAYRRYGIAS